MRVSIFIDGNNFYYSMRRIFGNISLLNFDFEKFCDFLIGDDRLVNIYYYNALLDRDNNHKKYLSQQKFYSGLKMIPNFNLVMCDLVKRKNNEKVCYVLKEDDIHLAVDMVEGACLKKYDLAILVSGDGDFVPAVRAIKRNGARAVNALFNKNSSLKLRENCNDIIKLNKGILSRFFK